MTDIPGALSAEHGAVYVQDIPLLGERLRLVADVNADPPRVDLEVTIDLGSAELLEETHHYPDFTVGQLAPGALADVTLQLSLLPEVAAERAELLRGSSDLMALVVEDPDGDDPHPPLSVLERYELEAWSVAVRDTLYPDL